MILAQWLNEIAHILLYFLEYFLILLWPWTQNISHIYERGIGKHDERTSNTSNNRLCKIVSFCFFSNKTCIYEPFLCFFICIVVVIFGVMYIVFIITNYYSLEPSRFFQFLYYIPYCISVLNMLCYVEWYDGYAFLVQCSFKLMKYVLFSLIQQGQGCLNDCAFSHNEKMSF